MSKEEDKEIELSSKTLFPHDLLFRGAMSERRVVLDFIENNIPHDILKHVDLNSLVLLNANFIHGALYELKPDVIYRANFHNKEKGRKPTHIYFAIEHQRTSLPDMPLRIMEYAAQIYRRHWNEYQNTELPIIYPVIVYNGTSPYHHSPNIFGMFEDSEFARNIFLTTPLLIDLFQTNDNVLQKKGLDGLLAIHLKHGYTKDISSFLKETSLFFPKIDETKDLPLLKLLTSYLLQTQDNKEVKTTILDQYKQYFTPSTINEIMSIADALVEEGIQKGHKEGHDEGLQKGRQEGLQEGEQRGFRYLLDIQIRRRFPQEITPKYLHLINDADSETLSIWGERLMDAKCIDDVFSDTQQLHG